jgi:hypothetical protein
VNLEASSVREFKPLISTDSPNITLIINKQIITRIEVITEVIVQQRRGLVSYRIERCYARPSFSPSNTVVSS